MKHVRPCALLLSLLLLVCALSSCEPVQKEPEMQAKSYYEFFDTQSTVFSYLGDSEEAFRAQCDAVEEQLSFYHRLFDIYYEYSGLVNLCTLNKNAGKGPIAVDRELIDFLLYAKEISALTDGRVNVALGAVLSLWHDCREDALDGKEARVPDPLALTEAARHTDLDAVVIDEAASTVEITDPALRLDVGALGKGYAAQRILEQMRAQQIRSYVLNLGGNLCVLGSKTTGEGWLTGITNPDRESDVRFACRITLLDECCVTSGNYERYYTVGEERYHHIIDPTTLYPADYFSSVTILCRDSALADALSTALFCMSETDGRALLSSIGDVDALWIYEDGRQSMTDGFRAKLAD